MSELGGRPALFESPEDLQQKIEEYYKSCEPKEIPAEKEGDPPRRTLGENLTVTGLALFLGFESRQSLYDYEKRDGFSYIIKKARLKVEHEYEKRLAYTNPTGAIFALKNMGWTDKQEIVSTNTIKDERIDLSKLSDDELRALAEIQSKSRTSQT